jgi:hypothetical protein
MDDQHKPYRPSNGTEGDCFMAKWCAKCKRDQARREDEDADGCDIVTLVYALNIGDAEYPKEWRQDGPEGPRCTAFEQVGIDL